MSSLQNKMYNYEVTPPPRTWEQIAVSLDESNLGNEFPSKLNAAEVTPPVQVWEKIASSLDAEKGAVAVMPRKPFSWIRLAAAAAIVGIIALGIMKWMDSTGPANNELAGTKNPSAKKELAEPEKVDVPATNIEKENVSPSEDPYIAKGGPAKFTRTKKQKNTYSISTKIEATDAVYAYNEVAPNLAERYVMLMTPNGIVRMSKKLGDFVCCVSGEEQDDNCKDQLKTWQEKLASTPASSTGNFMDILSLVSSLENEL